MASRQLDEEAIFLVARGIADTVTRIRYLEQICAGDPKLRERVEALLAVHEGADEFLKSARDPGPTLEYVSSQEAIGEEIGRYKLRERLGEGGFGVVWAAEQFTPVRRKVALKIVKPGMDTVLARSYTNCSREPLPWMRTAIGICFWTTSLMNRLMTGRSLKTSRRCNLRCSRRMLSIWWDSHSTPKATWTRHGSTFKRPETTGTCSPAGTGGPGSSCSSNVIEQLNASRTTATSRCRQGWADLTGSGYRG